MVKMKKLKGILLFIVLLSILFICISSINASDVSDKANITSDGSGNIPTDSNNLNSCNVSNELLKSNQEVKLGSNISNNGNYLNGGDISDFVNINQTTDNSFVLEMDNTTTNIYRAHIYDLDSFKNVTRTISSGLFSYDTVVMDFKDNLILEIDANNGYLINPGFVKNMILRGNNVTISVRNPNERDEKHFMAVGEHDTLTLNGITIKGFNTAIMNHGVCQFRNVNFDSNRESYILTADHGGAIRNYGILTCSNCSFSQNKAKTGGAVYNYKGSQSMFFNCLFSNNIASANADPGNIQTADGNNIYTCKGANCFMTSDNDSIYTISINTTSELTNALKDINKLGHVRDLIINFAPDATFKLAKEEGIKFSFDSVENLFIIGNGATISVDTENSDECHFLKVFKGQNYQITNLTITGFNKAIINEGSLSLTDTTLKNNKCDYYFSEDYGGAIYNDEGILYLTRCNFEDNYAKYGGAIYNNHGVLRCNDCYFESNRAYKDGGAIYNYQGHLTSIKTTFSKSKADDDGGAIYNDHGEMVLNDNFFDRSSADDEGGAVYNDFGKITLSNNIFTESYASSGKDLFTYGDEAKYYVANDSFVIQEVEDGFVCKTLKVTSDTASEAIRWTLRITEIGLCVAMCIGCTLSGMPETAAGVIGFIGGGLFAAGEEVIEDCYLDHNFNIWNVVVMAGIAGFLDMVGTGLSTWIGKTVFHVQKGVELAAAAKFKLETICFFIELTAEVITEVIPRFDFSEFEVPTPPENKDTSFKSNYGISPA